LLATLYGEAESNDDDLHARNRTAWNRFMAAELTDDARALLIKEGRCSAEDLRPFSPEELSEVEQRSAERCRQATGEAGTAGADLPLPDVKQHRIDFSNVKFDRPFLAKGFFFPAKPDVEFGEPDFSGAIFSNQADFSGATFSGMADFSGTTFSGSVDFSGTTFSGSVDFSGATFSDWAVFSGATFSDWAIFSGATFSGATFPGLADFSGASFSGANFRGASFRKETLFVNAKMKGPTRFEDATFSTAPPGFFGAKLHEGTVWRGVKWPPPPRDRKEAGRFVDAYERLKLEMDRLKKHEDELLFFALEMQSRRVLYGDWQQVPELKIFGRTIPVPPLEIPEKTIAPKPCKLFGQSFTFSPFTIKARTIRLPRTVHGLAIALYGLLSDYGRSYVRPLCGLLITVAIGVLPFWWHLCGFWQAVGLSFANTFGVLGFRKDLIDPQVLTTLPSLLKLVAVAQTIIGIVLLFLFGLAIRNRFRMK
jgi:uncharacterized protein YjbI with pentapeptide repeats